jgi:homoaconitase/3-isopropylmalate dehydratase large subunit
MAAHMLDEAFGDALVLHDPSSIVAFEDHLSYVHRSPAHVAQGLIGGVQGLSRAHREFVARHRLRHHGYLHHDNGGVLRIECDGVLPAGTSAKDLVLHLLALPQIRDGAGVGRVFEFGGSAVRALATDERATLTNMTAELGGFTGIVEPDDETVHFLRERRGITLAVEPWMRSDPGAHYAATIRIDAGVLSPMVARPGDPGHCVPLATLRERPHVDIAYGGSCTAGKREDFDQYHAVLAWAAQRGLTSRAKLYLSSAPSTCATTASRAAT